MLRDGKSKQNTVILMAEAVTADTYSLYLDLNGDYEEVLITVTAEMTTADATNYFTPTLYEANTTPTVLSAYSAVATADLVGSFTVMNDTINYATEVSYTGNERYLTVLIDETLTAIGEVHVSASVRRARDTAIGDPTTGTAPS